jgi:hypothetical protein
VVSVRRCIDIRKVLCCAYVVSVRRCIDIRKVLCCAYVVRVRRCIDIRKVRNVLLIQGIHKRMVRFIWFI